MDEIKLNLGCAARPLEGYVNIDMDSKSSIIKRYPNSKIPDNIKIYQYNILNLPYDNNSIQEVRCDCLMEHLSFKEEGIFWNEVYRVLKPGGIFNFSVPDFAFTINSWMKADDNWLEFFRDDDEAIQSSHWFGNYEYSFKNRWGYLTAAIFGSQNGNGQFHKNAYTEEKIQSICKSLNFNILELNRYKWKESRPDLIIKVTAEKSEI